MTLLDQDGRIIARTLNNDRWVGQSATPKLIQKSRAAVARSSSTNIWRTMARLYLSTPAGWALKASFQSGSTLRIAAGRRRRGSKRKIQRARR